MKSGKSMPVNEKIVNYKTDPHGKERIVTPGGDVVACVTGINADEATGFGYVSHFATCPNARSHRRWQRKRAASLSDSILVRKIICYKA